MATSTDPNAGSNKWQLSPYELSRQPQPVITDNTEIAATLRSIEPDITCVICMEILNTTMTAKKCMHRFCHDCIITALRIGNKECPTCRVKLASKRSLRLDPNFDALISSLVPRREDYEEQQQRLMAKVSKPSSFPVNIEKAIRLQVQNQIRGSKMLADDKVIDENKEAILRTLTSWQSKERKVEDSEDEEGNETHSDQQLFEKEKGSGAKENEAKLANTGLMENDVELIIKPLYHDSKADSSLNTVRYLKMKMKATVNDISKYLEIRYDIEHDGSGNCPGKVSVNASSCPFEMFIATGPAQYHPLPGEWSLKVVQDKYWKEDRPLELFYAYKMICEKQPTVPGASKKW